MLLDVLRYTVFGVFVLSSAVALGSWAVRTRRIGPFSKPAQLIRRVSDPILKPIESIVHRRGGNPQQAEWWLLGGVMVGGIIVISLSGWLIQQFRIVTVAGRSGPFTSIRLLLYYAGQLVILSIFARVVGSWFGIGRYNRYMRPAYFLTDWIIEPLRKIIPPFGMIDFSPLAALILMWIATGLII